MRWLGLLLLAACKFSTAVSGDGGVDGKEVDAAIDAPPDAFDEKCFGGGPYYLCLAAVPMADESLDNDDTLDTGACTGANFATVMLGSTPACAVVADRITLGGGQATGVFGARPLVLVAVTEITIDGVIDVSSVIGDLGPGANAAQCDGTGIDGAMNVAGGGGGAGGTFGTKGGDGGTGGGGAGGVATMPAAKSDILRGGCPGGRGMPGNANMAAGGPGGGAIYLVSRGTITINGRLNANGGGGAGGLLSKGGGGGGGSGGMIVFHAGTLAIGAGARIVANGGGGGGGAGNNDNGDVGQESDPATVTSVALGGQTATAGRSLGGNGAAGATAATPGSNGGNGGGGGGGGQGQIRVLAGGLTFPANTASPTPTN